MKRWKLPIVTKGSKAQNKTVTDITKSLAITAQNSDTHKLNFLIIN
ncbi:hypothetical protein XIS1_1160023 [Xenorhabdus innexi]|uniref:Uncharacterized protein n=1 Tax=Xenorhabdus innexi TaxID=290109 RepID=A0A1N6MRG9_9GAMM|nr:hypothetical protein XIS1_1160023 [Xenorhabdus innexi]